MKTTFEELINKEFEGTEPVNISELVSSENKMQIKIPSDYCYLLLNSNGFSNKNGYEIAIDKINPIVEIDDFVNLEWLIKEREYDLEDEDAKVYCHKFLRIAGCYNQDRILIGYEKEVYNEIHMLDYENEQTIKICDSIFVFINEHLVKHNS